MKTLEEIARNVNAYYEKTGELPELPTLNEAWIDPYKRLEYKLYDGYDFQRIFYLTGKKLRRGVMDHDDWYELITRMDRVVMRMKTW